MSLNDILKHNEEIEIKKQGLSEQRIINQMDNLRSLISFYR